MVIVESYVSSGLRFALGFLNPVYGLFLLFRTMFLFHYMSLIATRPYFVILPGDESVRSSRCKEFVEWFWRCDTSPILSRLCLQCMYMLLCRVFASSPSYRGKMIPYYRS